MRSVNRSITPVSLIAQIRANLYNDPMPQLNVSLPEGLKAWTDARVSEGRFSSPSDYVRDLIRRDQDAAAELQWLQGEIDKGLASPTLDIDPRELIDRIIAEGRAAHAV